jgi:hypothetical protein
MQQDPRELELEQLRIALDAAVDAHRELADELADKDAALVNLADAVRAIREAHQAGAPVDAGLAAAERILAAVVAAQAKKDGC